MEPRFDVLITVRDIKVVLVSSKDGDVKVAVNHALKENRDQPKEEDGESQQTNYKLQVLQQQQKESKEKPWKEGGKNFMDIGLLSKGEPKLACLQSHRFILVLG